MGRNIPLHSWVKITVMFNCLTDSLELEGCRVAMAKQTNQKKKKMRQIASFDIAGPRSSPIVCSCRSARKGKIIPHQAARSLTRHLSVLVHSGWMTEVEVSHASAWTAACPLSPPERFLLSLSQFFNSFFNPPRWPPDRISAITRCIHHGGTKTDASDWWVLLTEG